ncbi:MAG TPA: DNA polymerase III subunit delta [Ktedonobacteraceae bacterium]|nr:DNA polymerase III subunit delta [Ktedonobacteraceae bacterium]
MFYLLHGDDEFTSREHLKKLRRQGNFEYNQDTYNGGEVPLATIIATCNTFPFLTDQRLVVVEGLPKKRRGESATSNAGSDESTTSASTAQAAAEAAPTPTGKGGKAKKGKKGGKSTTETRAGFEKGLVEYIVTMPDTCVLIVLLDEVLDANNALVKAAGQHGQVIQSTLPKGAAIETWVKKRTQSIGVSISPDAAALLANLIGNQLRLLANELDKLATYVGDGATITADDVRKLSAHVQEARIFDLTDALAQRNRTQALNILHDLLADGEPPLKLISTITSQVRSLLLVKELSQQGMRSAQIASTIGVAPFVADKALRQVGKFTPTQLEGAYRQLLATDAALKRSRMTPEVALDLLVVGFGNNP